MQELSIYCLLFFILSQLFIISALHFLEREGNVFWKQGTISTKSRMIRRAVEWSYALKTLSLDRSLFFLAFSYQGNLSVVYACVFE